MSLAPLYHVLKFECDENPSVLGLAVSGLDQILERIHNFIGTRAGGDVDNFFFLSSDLAQCYDRIDQEKLFDIASQLFTQESYLVAKSTIVSKGSRVRVRRPNYTMHTHPFSLKPESVDGFVCLPQHERSVSTLGGIRPVWNRAMRVAERNAHSVNSCTFFFLQCLFS